MTNSKIRKAARGQDCTLRFYPYCNGNPETTVLAHLPSIDKGIGIKSPDHHAVFSCSDCHDIIDKRRYVDLPVEIILERMLAGHYETKKILIEMGLIKVAA